MNKKFISGIILLIGGILFSIPANAKPDTPYIFENYFKIKREKMLTNLNLVRSKVYLEVKEKITVKAEKEKAAALIVAEEEKKAAETTQQIAPVEKNDVVSSATTSEVVSGASQNWEERRNKGREYGESLSDPNLSQEERKNIVEEKKNYFRNGR